MKLFYNFFYFFYVYKCPHFKMNNVHALSCGWGESWSNFFFQKKYFFPTFFQTPLCFPSCFTLWIIFQFVIPVYIFFYINGTIVEKPDLNFLRELFWSLIGLWPKLRNLTWILLENSFNFLGDFQANFKKLGLNSPWEAFTSSNL